MFENLFASRNARKPINILASSLQFNPCAFVSNLMYIVDEVQNNHKERNNDIRIMDIQGGDTDTIDVIVLFSPFLSKFINTITPVSVNNIFAESRAVLGDFNGLLERYKDNAFIEKNHMVQHPIGSNVPYFNQRSEVRHQCFGLAEQRTWSSGEPVIMNLSDMWVLTINKK